MDAVDPRTASRTSGAHRAGPDGGDSTIPIHRLRALVVDNMRRSLQGSAQLTLQADLDAGPMIARRMVLKTSGIPASFEDLIIEALGRVLPRHPRLNGTIDQRTITLRGTVDISVALSVRAGLVALVLPDVAHLMLAEIVRRRRDLVARAAASRLSVAELTGGSFTVSNLGLHRIRFFTPILNAPQIAILGIGRPTPQLGLGLDGALVPTSSMGLSLTFDHRATDGAPAAAFLSDLIASLEMQADGS